MMDTNVTLIRGKGIRLVIEGFGVLTAAQFLPWLILNPLFQSFFPEAPPRLISMLTSSAISPIIASVYLFIRTKLIPKAWIDKETFYIVLAGIVVCWILDLLTSLFCGVQSLRTYDDGFIKNLSIGSVMIIVLRTLWQPLIEETLFRGYFQEILRIKWSNAVKAVLVTSLLFTLPHLTSDLVISGGVPSILANFVHISISSFIYGLAYIRGGLVASSCIHAFANAYRLFL